MTDHSLIGKRSREAEEKAREESINSDEISIRKMERRVSARETNCYLLIWAVEIACK